MKRHTSGGLVSARLARFTNAFSRQTDILSNFTVRAARLALVDRDLADGALVAINRIGALLEAPYSAAFAYAAGHLVIEGSRLAREAGCLCFLVVEAAPRARRAGGLTCSWVKKRN